MSYPQYGGGYAAGPTGPPQFFHGQPQNTMAFNQPRMPFGGSPFAGRGGMPYPNQGPPFGQPGAFQQAAFYPPQANAVDISGMSTIGVNGVFAATGQPTVMPPFGAPPGMRAVPPPPGLRGQRPPRPISYAPSDGKESYDPEAVVTCFIGNIDERATENLMRNLLQRCGAVANWKRVHGANNKLQAFGFCEFVNAEGALRAVRVLDRLQLAAKELQVKIGNKQHPLVLAYRNEMKSRIGPSAEEDEVDEMTRKVDDTVRDALAGLLKDYESDLTKPLPDDSLAKLKKKSDKDASIEEIEMEEEKRQLISREIQNFRETYKGSDEVLEERIKAAGRAQRKSPNGRVSPESLVSAEDSAPSTTANVKRRKSRSVSVASSSSSAEAMDAPTRRRDNRRLAEQDKLYQDLLEEWTGREKRKAKEQEKEEAKEKLKRAEERKTAKRLIRVYEDYDDDKMDDEYYKGAALSRLLKDRKKEMEADERDREKEAKLLEELKQKLLADGHPDAEAHVRQLELKQQEHTLPKHFKEVLSDVIARHDDPVPGTAAPSGKSGKFQSVHPPAQLATSVKMELGHSEPSSRNNREANATVSFQQAPSSRLMKKHGAGEVFGNSDEEVEKDDHGERRKRLFRFDDETEKKRQMAEQKKLQAKKLIESIPTKKEELFEYPVAWSVLDKSLMNLRVKPWITKKVGEYMGEEEQSLIDFIAQKVVAQVNPKGLITDISIVLDEDAEIFVVKLWRLLIYETEMKKIMQAVRE